MKKYFSISVVLLLVTALLAGCSKKDFDENYYNPEKSVTANIPHLYTGLLYNHDRQNMNTIFPRYWNLFTFQVPMLGTYTQTNGYFNNPGVYEQALAYSQTRWEYYYTAPLASFREMEKLYNGLTDDSEKAGYLPFLETGRIFLYDQTAQMVDMWGDIPFSEAGQLNTTGGQIILAKYDKQDEIYNFILDDLKRIADYLADYQANPFYKAQLDKADIINLGDIKRWRIYANSLRLRLAMRISLVNESKSQAIVTEILNNSDRYPIVTNNDETVQIKARGDQLRSVIGVDGIKNAIIGYPAPDFMVNGLLNPSGDPRLQVMFSKNVDGEYKGLPIAWSASEQNAAMAANEISRIDTATYTRNDKFPGIIITAAEISFFKAEAAERWGLGDAKAEYEKGIRQSIEYLYYINALNDNADGTNFVAKVPPTEQEISAFLANAIVSYTGSQSEKLEKIGTQQWLNYGLIQSYLGWSEVRRTGFPRLTFVTDNSSNQAPLPPNRLVYPESERNYNSVNYQAVQAQDQSTTKLFWDVN